MTALDQIAPYPARESDVTAQSLSMSLAARAYAAYWCLPDNPAGSLEAALVAQTCGVIYLLRDVADREGTDIADGLARYLWRDWTDLGGLGLDLLARLEDAGIEWKTLVGAVSECAVQAVPDGGA